MDIVVLGVVRLASAFTPWGTLKVMLTPLRHATPDHPPHLPPIRHPRARYLTRDATPPSDPPASLAAPECTSPTSPPPKSPPAPPSAAPVRPAANTPRTP